MILSKDKWRECIRCPYCFDDDEALYCELEECVMEQEKESDTGQDTV